MEVWQKLVVSSLLILGSLTAGYVARKLRWLGETTARVLMTIVMIFGYSSVQFLAVWNAELSAELIWLPIIGGATIALMSLVGLSCARMFTSNRAEMGVFSIASGAPNTGVTMGGLVLLALYGGRGLELMSIYCIMWMPMIVGVMYPIARHYSPAHAGGSLGRLMLRSVFDWRSIGLPMAALGLALNFAGVARPPVVEDLHIVDVLAAATTAASYFSIGLGLSLRGVARIGRLIFGLALTRFIASGLVAAGLAWLVTVVGCQLSLELRNTLIILAVMPAAVATVGIANMFELRPSAASTLFVVNTLMFIVLIMPVVFWIFG